MITGDITQISTDTKAFGFDLLKLGDLIPLDKLNDWGSPALLLYQITKTLGIVTTIQVALTNEKISKSVVANLNDPKATVSDNVQKLMYIAMTKITGTELTNILKALNVKTKNINTMADLLNPVKIFPTSYQTLSVITIDGQQLIYASGTTTPQPDLVNLLPPYIMKSTV
jgi:hypothetical protein